MATIVYIDGFNFYYGAVKGLYAFDGARVLI